MGSPCTACSPVSLKRQVLAPHRSSVISAALGWSILPRPTAHHLPISPPSQQLAYPSPEPAGKRLASRTSKPARSLATVQVGGGRGCSAAAGLCTGRSTSHHLPQGRASRPCSLIITRLCEAQGLVPPSWSCSPTSKKGHRDPHSWAGTRQAMPERCRRLLGTPDLLRRLPADTSVATGRMWPLSPQY